MRAGLLGGGGCGWEGREGECGQDVGGAGGGGFNGDEVKGTGGVRQEWERWWFLWGVGLG